MFHRTLCTNWKLLYSQALIKWWCRWYTLDTVWTLTKLSNVRLRALLWLMVFVLSVPSVLLSLVVSNTIEWLQCQFTKKGGWHCYSKGHTNVFQWPDMKLWLLKTHTRLCSVLLNKFTAFALFRRPALYISHFVYLSHCCASAWTIQR